MKTLIKNLSFFLLLFCTLIPSQSLQSCGYNPDPELFRFSLFHPELSQLAQYRPFYFTTEFLNEGVPELIQSGMDKNLEEWAAYFDGELTTQDIQAFLYDYTFSEADANFMTLQEVKNSPLYQYKVVKHLVEQEDHPTMDYILYAKLVENALRGRGAWEEEDASKSTLQKLIDGAKGAYKTANPKLQLRYAYQMVILARYLEDYSQAVELYNQYLQPLKSKSIVKYWGMMHRATALYHIGKTAQADYNFAMAFKNAPNKRHRAYQGFEGKEMEASLRFAGTSEEKAALWLMKGIKNPGKALESLLQAYLHQPNMPELELLITREINKLEDWLLTPRYTGFEPAGFYFNYGAIEAENKRNDEVYLGKVLNFVEKGIENKNVHNLTFWNLAAAYLSFMQGNYLQSNNYLHQVELADTQNETIKNQTHLLRIMAFANDYGGISKEAEQELFTSLQWLQKQSFAQVKEQDRYGETKPTVLEKVYYALAARYEKNKDFHKAAMYLSKVANLLRAPEKEFIGYIYRDYFYYLNEQATTKDLHQILEVIAQKDKSPYQKFLVSDIGGDKIRIQDLLGTMYLRQDKLEEALEVFQQVPSNYWKSEGATAKSFNYHFYLAANPFYADFYSGHVPTEADTVRYTKSEFVAEMMRLKAIAAEGGLDEAECNFLLASGYYNMTYYGNSWMMVHYWWSNNWKYSIKSKENDVENMENFYGCKRAKAYYVKAAETAMQCSFAALCYRMAGKCDYRQKNFERYYTAENVWETKAPTFESNAYYQLLKNNFSNYYDRLIDDCSSFKDFVAWGDY